MRFHAHDQVAAIPMQMVGPLRLVSKEITGDVPVPLATFESPLWPSTHRGALLSQKTGGIHAVISDERMTRSVLLETDSAIETHRVAQAIQTHFTRLQTLAKETSRFATLIDMHREIVGPLLYLRFEFLTGDASGHNMTTIAAERLLEWLLQQYTTLRYVSISGNYCTDKKVSAVNGILGRGKHVIAEMTITRALCQRFLKTTPEKIVALNLKKNLIGGIVAGSLRSANAHYANMLLGFYLATGQDAANLVEGSQGITYAEMREDQLYFSVTLPNVIVGAVGNGKSLDFVQRNFLAMGLSEQSPAGLRGRQLAIIAGATVLCGELSLMAAQTNIGELAASHIAIERHKEKT